MHGRPAHVEVSKVASPATAEETVQHLRALARHWSVSECSVGREPRQTLYAPISRSYPCGESLHVRTRPWWTRGEALRSKPSFAGLSSLACRRSAPRVVMANRFAQLQPQDRRRRAPATFGQHRACSWTPAEWAAWSKCEHRRLGSADEQEVDSVLRQHRGWPHCGGFPRQRAGVVLFSCGTLERGPQRHALLETGRRVRSVARHRRQHRRRPVVSSDVPDDQRIVSRRESRHFDVGDNAARVRTMPYDADVTMQAWRRARPRQGVVMVMAMVLVGVVTSCQPGGMFQQPRIEQPVPTASGPPPPPRRRPAIAAIEMRLHADRPAPRRACTSDLATMRLDAAAAPVCSVDIHPACPARRSAGWHTRKLRPRRAQECAQ